MNFLLTLNLPNMKQVLLLAAIYSLVLYQSQKNAKEKILPAAQRSVAKAASLPLKVYQHYLEARAIKGGSPGSASNLVFARLKNEN
jgi:hypothetical protein